MLKNAKRHSIARMTFFLFLFDTYHLVHTRKVSITTTHSTSRD